MAPKPRKVEAKKVSPSKFKMASAQPLSKPSRDQHVYTYCGKPGYALAFILKQNGDGGFFYPFQKKVEDADASVDHLNIIAVVNRIIEGTQTCVTSGRYNCKQFLAQFITDTMDDLKEQTREWGHEVTVALNACSFTYPTNFVYRGDISGLDGKDIKRVLQLEDVKTFVRKCYPAHLANDEFFQDQDLMNTLFDERDWQIISTYFITDNEV